uniref:Uncharacterized protein n=1 Tax=Knipowitschia caucasica TaxID=637954 RepID=A0AAV2J0E4_KNICA
MFWSQHEKPTHHMSRTLAALTQTEEAPPPRTQATPTHNSRHDPRFPQASVVSEAPMVNTNTCGVSGHQHDQKPQRHWPQQLQNHSTVFSGLDLAKCSLLMWDDRFR